MRKGLFIGINDYTHVSRLSGCSNDAMAMASVLKTDANGDPNFKNIVLTSAEDYLSREKLEDQIRELFAGDCNVALLYFAGHGSFDTDTDEGMLIPQDYKSAKDGIRLSDILNWASKATKIKNKVIILDCCQSGSAGELRALRSEGSVVGEVQQGDIAVPGKQLADLVFEFFPAEVVLGGGQDDVLEVRIAVGVGLQHGGHGHGVIAAAAQARNVGVVVDADKQSLAHGYTAVCWRMALMMLLVFHAHSLCAASRTTLEMRSAPNGLIAMMTLPMRLAISISLLIHLL